VSNKLLTYLFTYYVLATVTRLREFRCLGVCTVTVLLAASALLVMLSFVWRRLSARSFVLTSHHLVPNAAFSDEEQGLLTDVSCSPAAAAAEGDAAEHVGIRSPARRPNTLASSDHFSGTIDLPAYLLCKGKDSLT